MMNANPLAMVCMASVAISAGTSKCATIMPLISPQTIPTRTPTTIAGKIPKPRSLMSFAETTPESAIIEPMEMSIPPVSRTIVMPTAQIPVMETCRQMFSRFFVDKNVFVRTEKKTNTNRSTR